MESNHDFIRMCLKCFIRRYLVEHKIKSKCFIKMQEKYPRSWKLMCLKYCRATSVRAAESEHILFY